MTLLSLKYMTLFLHNKARKSDGGVEMIKTIWKVISHLGTRFIFFNNGNLSSGDSNFFGINWLNYRDMHVGDADFWFITSFWS